MLLYDAACVSQHTPWLVEVVLYVMVGGNRQVTKLRRRPSKCELHTGHRNLNELLENQLKYLTPFKIF